MLFVRQSWMDTNAYSRIIIMSLELSINIIIIIINEDNLNAVNIRCYKTCNGNLWRHYLLVLILVSCFHQEEKLYVVEEKGETKENVWHYKTLVIGYKMKCSLCFSTLCHLWPRFRYPPTPQRKTESVQKIYWPVNLTIICGSPDCNGFPLEQLKLQTSARNKINV